MNSKRQAAKGLGLFLGDLEAAVLDAFYSGDQTIPQVHKRLGKDRITYSAVATTVSRLVAKSMLERSVTPAPNPDRFSPVVSREQFIEQSIEAMIRPLVTQHGIIVGKVIRKIAGVVNDVQRSA